MQQFYDVVVIGSGFGGSIVACRLAQHQAAAGKKVSVCVLERGKRYHMGEFPRDLARPKDWWWRDAGKCGWTGLIEFRTFKNISAVVGSGVGGTSLIYANVQIDAFDSTFDIEGPEGKKRWPESVDWRNEMPRHYAKVAEMLRPSPVRDPALKTLALRQAASGVGQSERFRLLDLAIFWGRKGSERGVLSDDPYGRGGPPQVGCDYCGECVIGCNTHSKNTVDLNYLWLAQKAGAEVYSQHKVVSIEQNPHNHPYHPLGYTVHFENVRWNFPGAVSAGTLVVAAGTLGTTELLLRSKHGYRRCRKTVAPTLPNLSAMLGKYFSGNGDFGAVGCETNRLVNLMEGPTITSVLDYHDRLDDHGFLIEEGGFPDLLRANLRRLPGGFAWNRKLLRLLKNLFGRRENSGLVEGIFRQLDYEAVRDALPYLVMGIDSADGEMSLSDEGDLNIIWNVDRNMQFFRDVEKTLREVTESSKPGLDGNLFLNPTWSVQKDLITVHPLGGCPMGDDDTPGVVSTSGEVVNYPNLYVADGAIVPTAVGPNPSKTIGALAERIAEKIIEKPFVRSRSPEAI